MKQQPNRSEVARLLHHIGEEYESAQAGLVGYAITARHQIINARLERIGDLHEQLHALVGEDAMRLIAEQLERLPDGPNDFEGRTGNSERRIPPCPQS